MGAHSAAGPGSRRTITATAGLAAALVTTAATGLLTGGTALATDGSGHGGSGHAHSHGHGSSGDWDTGWNTGWDSDGEQGPDADGGLGAQAWCDVLGDVDLGDRSACAADGGSSDASGPGDSAANAAATTAPAAPAPKPRPTSSVPDHPTIQPIVAPASGRRVVPIAH
jgi:hypothetical protein